MGLMQIMMELLASRYQSRHTDMLKEDKVISRTNLDLLLKLS
jgi:hypothetical protein